MVCDYSAVDSCMPAGIVCCTLLYTYLLCLKYAGLFLITLFTAVLNKASVRSQIHPSIFYISYPVEGYSGPGMYPHGECNREIMSIQRFAEFILLKYFCCSMFFHKKVIKFMLGTVTPGNDKISNQTPKVFRCQRVFAIHYSDEVRIRGRGQLGGSLGAVCCSVRVPARLVPSPRAEGIRICAAHSTVYIRICLCDINELRKL